MDKSHRNLISMLAGPAVASILVGVAWLFVGHTYSEGHTDAFLGPDREGLFLGGPLTAAAVLAGLAGGIVVGMYRRQSTFWRTLVKAALSAMAFAYVLAALIEVTNGQTYDTAELIADAVLLVPFVLIFCSPFAILAVIGASYSGSRRISGRVATITLVVICGMSIGFTLVQAGCIHSVRVRAQGIESRFKARHFPDVYERSPETTLRLRLGGDLLPTLQGILIDVPDGVCTAWITTAGGQGVEYIDLTAPKGIELDTIERAQTFLRQHGIREEVVRRIKIGQDPRRRLTTWTDARTGLTLKEYADPRIMVD